MSAELATQMRGMVVQGVVQGIDDTGEAQTITVQTHEGVLRSEVEVLSFHGFASNPGDGATALLLAVGGDQDHMVALPMQNYSTRYGGLPAGGVALHDDAGNRLVLPGDGTGLLTTGALFSMLVQAMLLQTQAGLTVRGPVTFEDEVTFGKDVTFKASVAIAGDLHVTGAITGATVNGK